MKLRDDTVPGMWHEPKTLFNVEGVCAIRLGGVSSMMVHAAIFLVSLQSRPRRSPRVSPDQTSRPTDQEFSADCMAQ